MNNLALIIVNEGKDYQNRLRIARRDDPGWRFSHWADRVHIETQRQSKLFGEKYTVDQMAQAVTELDHYYQQHIKEL